MPSPLPQPEAQARIKIDELLEAAGWQVQDNTQINLYAQRGVAVREFPLKTGFADYLLFVDGKAIGAVEAKKAGTTLSGVAHQSKKYSEGLPPVPPAWRKPLPFLYESTGIETYFTNNLDPEPRSRRVFAFHQPATLAEWVSNSETLRSRLRKMPELITTGMREAQIEAVTNLEKSLAEDRPRALIQMATGSGKTFTTVSAVYRLIKFARAKRVLFLVDRSNLGRQTLREFQQYVTPDDGRKFSELYNVQQLTTNTIDPVSKVCITTIQRLYSMLSGEELNPEDEEQSLFELDSALAKQPPKTVKYNRAHPIEEFDFIVVDECHRSIYNLWRQVLEYFDAHLVGLTATPSKQTLGFFNRNLVMEYSRQRAVADGVNVDELVYTIRTKITREGSTIEAGEVVGKRDRLTRAQRWEQLDDDYEYAAPQLDRDVVAEDQIRTVIRTFKERIFTDLFPGRTVVPKTLIFAKDDNHAEQIVEVVRQEFGKGNDFCEKITYKVSGRKPEELIRDFRIDYNPRIAVTVDMIATGTDIKPLEVLVFMRSVKSKGLYQQMVGRGTRAISATDLKAVTDDAQAKTHFWIVDAVGVVDNPKFETESLERKPSLAFDKLLQTVALGARDEDTLLTLAGRLARLDRRLSPTDRQRLQTAAGGSGMSELINALEDAADPDKILEAAQFATGLAAPPATALEAAQDELAQAAVKPFAANPAFRNELVAIQQRNEVVIDTSSIDEVLEAGYSASGTEKARSTVTSFKEFLEQHRDEITALQILYNQPYATRQLTFKQIKELSEQLKAPPRNWTLDILWQAYARLEPGKVRGAEAKRVLTDLVSLVRHVTEPDGELVPYPELVKERYLKWLSEKEVAGQTFSAEQRWWLDQIAKYIGVNLSVDPGDLNIGEFQGKGGSIGITRAFGQDWRKMLDELNEALAA